MTVKDVLDLQADVTDVTIVPDLALFNKEDFEGIIDEVKAAFREDLVLASFLAGCYKASGGAGTLADNLGRFADELTKYGVDLQDLDIRFNLAGFRQRRGNLLRAAYAGSLCYSEYKKMGADGPHYSDEGETGEI